MSGRYYHSTFYGVDKETEEIDYDAVLRAAEENRPKLIICGASAYPRVIDFKKMREIADAVGAYLMADIAHIGGLVATGLHPSPVPYAHVVTSTTHKTLRGPRGAIILTNDENLAKKINSGVFPRTQGGPLEHVIAAKAVCFKEAMSPEYREYNEQIIKNAKALADALSAGGVRLVTGGTDNHLMLADVMSRGKTGKEVQDLLDMANITANKNTIPYDTQKPSLASGMRFGTPAATTRGMKEDDMSAIGGIILKLLEEGEAAVPECKEQVLALCEKYPLYPGL